MTNQAISLLLGHLSSVARNVEAGVLEMPRSGTGERGPSDCATQMARLENMLWVVDDLQEIAGVNALAGVAKDHFDAGRMIAETIELLNLVVAGQKKRFHIRGAAPACWIFQNRYGLDYAVMRLLKAALEISSAQELQILVEPNTRLPGIRISLFWECSRQAETILKWMKQDLSLAAFSNQQEVPCAVALMVAGKRFGLLNCQIATHQAGGGSQLLIDVPTLAGGEVGEAVNEQDQPGSLSVLVAEDFDESFLLTSLALEGEKVWRARNGCEALSLARQQVFDLVLMDVHMPGLDGYSAIRAIREWETEAGRARTPVIILSSDEIETQKRAAAQAGCSGFLRKPLCSEELRAMIAKLKGAQVPSGDGPLKAGLHIH